MKSKKLAQRISTHRKWYIKLWHYLTFWVDRKIKDATFTTTAVHKGEIKAVRVSEVWEQINDSTDVQIERDCKLICKFPDTFSPEPEKTYWIVLDEKNIKQQFNES